MGNEIKLRNALNFRDIGGYKSRLGGTVKKGLLYRSNSLAFLEQPEIEIIVEMGVKTVIDLRTAYEASQGECKLKSVDGIEYHNVSLIDNIHSKRYEDLHKSMPESMAKLYINLLDNSAQDILTIFNIILEGSENSVVFNCTAGKDRTGIIAALILDLLGVDAEDIFGDYVLTEELMEPVFGKIRKDYETATGTIMPNYMLESKRESMVEFYEHLYDKYNGAQEYLLEKGFGQEKIEQFRKTYLED